MFNVWFWVFAVLIAPVYVLVSGFALLQLRNVLTVILSIKTTSIPESLKFLSPVLVNFKALLREAFGNMNQYKPKMTEVLLFALIVAILGLMPSLWEMVEVSKADRADRKLRAQKAKQQ